MDDKITIIEGPPPTFEAVNDTWIHGLSEGRNHTEMVLTRLRTVSGPTLVERCVKSWNKKRNINLEFRTEDGLDALAPIVAARAITTEEGDMLLLWLRMIDEAVELELGYEDDTNENDEDEWGLADDLI